MAQADVERVIGRAVTDAAFRKALIDSARTACAGYDLTDDEIESLERLDSESMHAFAGSLDTRISKKGGTGFI